MYLLTDDKGLHDITNEIVLKPMIIFPDDFKETEKYQCFEPIKPERFMVVFKGKPSK